MFWNFLEDRVLVSFQSLSDIVGPRWMAAFIDEDMNEFPLDQPDIGLYGFKWKCWVDLL